MEWLINILPQVQITLALFLVLLIIFQKSEAGVGGAFGGGDTSAGVSKRRGFEKILFVVTIIVAVLFVLSAVLSLFF